jgi:flagellar hook-associated protein 2
MTTRITGLVSNLDIDSLVTAGVSLQQSKLDKAKQAQQIAEWEQTAYQSIETSVTDFYSKYLDVASSDTSNCLTLDSNWITTSFASTNSAGTTSTAVTAEATSTSADAANYTVNVSQLASASTCVISSSTIASANKITVAGKDYTLSGTTAQDRATDLNSQLATAGVAISAKYNSYANNGSGGFELDSTALGSASTFSVALDGTTQSVTAGKNLNATITNGSNTYTISDTTNTTASNSITLDGVKFTCNAVTGTVAAPNPVTITGSKDVSALQTKITSFVNDYSTLMKTINTKIYETYDKSYAPLTDSQKSSMTDSQITKWETQAQVGLLRKDSYLEKLTSDMKNSLTTVLGGTELEKLGISPVDDYTTKNGMYTVTSSSTLKSALEDNLSSVKSLFLNGISSTTALSTTNSSTDGILSRLKVALNNNVCRNDSAISQKAGNENYATTTYTNEIYLYLKDQSTLIDDLKTKLSDKEDALYAKYSTMETNLSSLQSESSLFSSSSSS